MLIPLVAQMVKICLKCRRPGLIPGSGRSPEEGNGNPLQHSCLGNPVDGGAWWATVHGITKSRTWLSNFTNLCWICERCLRLLFSLGFNIVPWGKCHYSSFKAEDWLQRGYRAWPRSHREKAADPGAAPHVGLRFLLGYLLPTWIQSSLLHLFFPGPKPSPLLPSILTSSCSIGVEEEGHPPQQVTGPSIHLGWLLLSGLKEDKNLAPMGFLPLPLTPRFDVTQAIFFLSPRGKKKIAYSYKVKSESVSHSVVSNSLWSHKL